MRRNRGETKRQIAGGCEATSSPLKSRTRPQSPPVNLREEVKEMSIVQGERERGLQELFKKEDES